MKTFIGLCLVMFVLAILTFSGLLVYTHFLIDYSLEDLHAAIALTEQKIPENSTLASHVYGSLVKDLAIQEGAKGKFNFKDVALLQMASRSFEETTSQEGYKQASVYLKILAKERNAQRTKFLQFSDVFRTKIMNVISTFLRILQYFHKSFMEKDQKMFKVDYATEVILSQAQIQERNGNFRQATELYQKFLTTNPASNQGMASIALANLLTKQNQFDESRRILENVRRQYVGLEEGALAGRFLQKLDNLKKEMEQIPNLKRLIALEKNRSKRDEIRLKLALAYISLYQLSSAQSILEEIQVGQVSDLQRKAKFYLAWVYKLQKQYEKGEKILMDLLDDPKFSQDLEFWLHSELADIYAIQNNSKGSLKYYQLLVDSVQKLREKKAFNAAWIALAELRQASIYKFNYQNSDKSQEHLKRLGQVLDKDIRVAGSENTPKIFDKVSNLSLRDRAFQAIESKQVGVAYDLFVQSITNNNTGGDAWSYAGLGIVYILSGNLKLATQHAEQGYHLKQDEYTASVLGYVYALSGRYQEALGLYQQATQSLKTYVPAQFNLGWLYLKLEDYQTGMDVFLKLNDSKKPINVIIRSKIFNNMGYAAWRLGDAPQAYKYIKAAASMNPEFEIAKRNLEFLKASNAQ